MAQQKPQPKKPETKAPEPAPATPEVQPKVAFTLERLAADPAKGITGGWQFVKMTYVTDDGVDRVVKSERTEPNIRPIAFETFKLAAIKYVNGVG